MSLIDRLDALGRYLYVLALAMIIANRKLKTNSSMRVYHGDALLATVHPKVVP